MNIPVLRHAQRTAAIVLLALSSGCGDCNCTVPPFNGGSASPNPIMSVIPNPSPSALTTQPPVTPILTPIPTSSSKTVTPSPVSTSTPTIVRTSVPIVSPTIAPTIVPTLAPTIVPTLAPTVAPTITPTAVPTSQPTTAPTSSPVALSCAQNAISGQGVPLGTDAAFAVLASSTVTNTGASSVTGNIGLSPGTAVTGFPPGVFTGVIDAGDSTAATAKLDLTTAYNNAAGRANALAVPAQLGGLVLTPGVYNSTVPVGISGTLTLDGQNNPNSVFVFQLATTLTAGTNSTIRLINAANPCNVFWQVGTAATLGTGSALQGTIMAQTSITFNTGATLIGRALAKTGAVTFDTNVVTVTGP